MKIQICTAKWVPAALGTKLLASGSLPEALRSERRWHRMREIVAIVGTLVSSAGSTYRGQCNPAQQRS